MKTKKEIMDDLGDTLKSIQEVIHGDALVDGKDALLAGIDYSLRVSTLDVLIDIRDTLKEFVQELK
jgi:hypothetical protein